MKRISLALALTLALAVPVSAQRVNVEKYTLPNGMTVILNPDRSVPLVTVNLWYRVGAKDEPAGRSGFAHLFEHLMFMGTQRVPTGQFDAIMEGGGGRNNASTAADRTNYYNTAPSNQLATLLWLEADRLEALGKNIDQKKLDLQRDVVLNERRQRVENSPYGEAYEAINRLMYPAGHPYATGVIGSPEDLRAATVNDVQNFFATYYVPSNASLVVAGDFDPAQVKPLIASLFGTLPRGNDVPRKEVPPVNFRGVKRVTYADAVSRSKVIMAWHSPAFYAPGDAELDLAAAVLSDGVSSRLYQELVVRRELATSVAAYQSSKQLGSLFFVEADLAEGKNVADLEAAIDEALRNFAAQGPTQEELARQSAKIEFGLVASLQSVEDRADQLNSNEFYLGDPGAFDRVLDRYRKATPQSVKDTVAQVLNPDNRLIMRVIPEVRAQGNNPRDTRPQAGTLPAYQPPLPREFTLSNGLRVRYWNRPELPLMHVSLRFNSGADADPAEAAGRTQLLASLMRRGAGERNATQFADALADLGASLTGGTGHLSTSLNLSSLASNFEKALPLLADAALRPRLEADEFERLRRLSVAGLQSALDDPETVADRVAQREFFGPSHPYGRPVNGTVKTLAALDLNTVKARYTELAQPQNTVIYAAGSLSENEVKAALEKNFGSWRASGQAPAAPVYPARTASGPRIIIVDRPDSEQTVIEFLMPAPALTDPRRVPLQLLGTVLGGSFTSRLNLNLREDKGYTYGAGAGYSFTPAFGVFSASAAVNADATGPALREFLAEFDRLRKGDISADETAKAALTRRSNIVTTLETLEGLTGSFANLETQGRPFSELQSDLEAYARTDAAALNAAAPEALPADRMVLVLVGDRSVIEQGLQGLNLPAPEVVQAD
ncbi:putative Zn-dependent peptidase [Deinobacterium chartae]|uniref:Putative Zn-dependent peptidase n=1 Tax=Deinobacterium chartae TaxID=521158 RepID=A0A841HXT7_9DEIO|nr:pitrilysin family protein [Deinobacterium chartae]MBB6097464.1 putative Zn-dependent peptidase [Deinobacterium chartae]